MEHHHHHKKGLMDDHRPQSSLRDTWTIHPYLCVFALAQAICLGIGIFPFAAFWLSVLLVSLSTACCFFLFWVFMSLVPLLVVLAIAAAWGIGLGVVGASLLFLLCQAGKKMDGAAVNGHPHKKRDVDAKDEDDKNRGPPASDSWIPLTATSDSVQEPEPRRRADESTESQGSQETGCRGGERGGEGPWLSLTDGSL